MWRAITGVVGDHTLIAVAVFALVSLLIAPPAHGGPLPRIAPVLALSTACRHLGRGFTIARGDRAGAAWVDLGRGVPRRARSGLWSPLPTRKVARPPPRAQGLLAQELTARRRRRSGQGRRLCPAIMLALQSPRGVPPRSSPIVRGGPRGGHASGSCCYWPALIVLNQRAASAQVVAGRQSGHRRAPGSDRAGGVPRRLLRRDRRLERGRTDRPLQLRHLRAAPRAAAATALWTANGVAVCTAALDQQVASPIADGAGGAIFVGRTAATPRRSISTPSTSTRSAPDLGV